MTQSPPPRQLADKLVVTRRTVIKGAAAVVVAGCGGDDAGGETNGTSTGNGAPQWSTIPDQVWTVGEPVELDLAQYCTDPDGDLLSFSLDGALPPGLTLEGSVIRGTPTASFAETSMVATADDGKS